MHLVRIDSNVFFLMAELFKILKDGAVKRYTQCIRKFGKLGHVHMTGKGQFSFQSQRRVMPKNVETTVQLSSFHMLERWCSKSFKLGFSSLNRGHPDVLAQFRKGRGTRGKIVSICWIMEKAMEFPEKLLLLHWLHWRLCVDHIKLWKIPKEMMLPGHLTCHLRDLYAGQETVVIIRYGTMNSFQIGKGVWQGCILSPCLFNLYTEYIMKRN